MTDFSVLHVIGGSEFGGIVPYVASLAKMTRQHGGNSKVLATSPRVVQYYDHRNIEVIPLEGIDRSVKPHRDLLGFSRLLQYLRQNQFDIVHTHTSKGGVIGRLAARLAQVPIIIHTTQGYAFRDYAQSRLEKLLFLQMERAAGKWCDMIISANLADRRLGVALGIAPEAKIVHIPNGIDLEVIDAITTPSDLPRTLGIDTNRKTVGVLGRLAPQKGMEFFIAALPEIQQAYPGVQFLVVGDGPLRVELESQVTRMGLSAFVRFTGFRSDWIEILQLVDVFVMPSLWEGLPMTLLGAMAVSRAIVATSIEGITDVCGEGQVALLVEPRNVPALSQAILSLLNDETLAHTLGQAARRRVENEFSETAMNARMWAIYSALLKTKQPDWQEESR